ncbi:LytR/AlgR family response regulator transcription factor [Rhodoflexus sp.]
MKIVVIDDEAHHRSYLQALLQDYSADIQVVGEADGVAAGARLIREQSPDVVLLDVEMQDGTGFDLLQKLQSVDFQVIFTTAHQTFAVQAFKFSAIDYLLKPVEEDLLAAALKRASENKRLSDVQLQLTALMGNIQSLSNEPKKIVLKDADNIHIVAISDIIRLEAASNYTQFHLADNRKIMISKTLKDYERLLEEYFFFRCHQSHLINLHYLQRIGKKDGGSVIMKDNTELPLATRKRDALIELLEKIFS